MEYWRTTCILSIPPQVSSLTKNLFFFSFLIHFLPFHTGEPTHWGFWNPKEVNEDPEHYSERGTNSIGILSYFASAYSVTRDEKYKKAFWDLAINFGYLYNSFNGKIDNPWEDNHSDNELIFMCYHILMYSLRRLDNSTDEALRADIQAMVDAMKPSVLRTWTIVNDELSPLWLGIYAGAAKMAVSESEVSNAVWSLRNWAIDMIEWPTTNDERWDITVSPYYSRDSTDPLMREIIPQRERRIAKWNSDPYELKDQGSGYAEEYPSVWRLPYFLMAYYKLIV